MGALDRRALFRVNRDVRFARDKSPYKTNVSLVLTRSGDKRDQGLFCLQHGLGSSFAAAGFYALQPPELAAFRKRVVGHAAAWGAVERELLGAGLTLSRDSAAERLPRGFTMAEVGGLGDALRLKSFTVARPLDAEALGRPELVAELATFAQAALLLLRFGWRALESWSGRADGRAGAIGSPKKPHGRAQPTGDRICRAGRPAPEREALIR